MLIWSGVLSGVKVSRHSLSLDVLVGVKVSRRSPCVFLHSPSVGVLAGVLMCRNTAAQALVFLLVC